MASFSLNLKPRRSIHQKNNLIGNHKEIIINSENTMKRTGIKHKDQTDKNNTNNRRTKSEESDNEEERDDLSSEESEETSEKSVDFEFSRERSVPLAEENSKFDNESFNNSSISTTSKRKHKNTSITNSSKIENTNPTYKSFLKNYIFLLFAFLVLIVIVFGPCSIDNSVKTKIDLKEIQKEFTTQDDFLWIAFRSGVHDVLTQNRPSTFILLYEKSAENTLEKLVQELSKYTICSITSCNNNPIILTPQKLNSPEVLKDYGKILEYKTQLEQVGVMIIKNLDQVQGVSAQAFHAFCDEFTPLVEKSLFIFTLEVDKMPETRNQMKFLDEYFRTKWTDVKSDTLNALITRITSMVIGVKA